MAAPEGPPPPMKDDAPDIVVTVVHKVKSKLGYTEIHTPAPPMDENGKVRNEHMMKEYDGTYEKNRKFLIFDSP